MRVSFWMMFKGSRITPFFQRKHFVAPMNCFPPVRERSWRRMFEHMASHTCVRCHMLEQIKIEACAEPLAVLHRPQSFYANCNLGGSSARSAGVTK